MSQAYELPLEIGNALAVKDPAPAMVLEKIGGNWRQTEEQRLDPQGVPLWHCEILTQVKQYGEMRLAILPVTWASRQSPAFKMNDSVNLSGVTARVERLTAENVLTSSTEFDEVIA